MSNDLLLRACRHEPVPRPPVWLMRQAGRYLPEYRALRDRVDFLTLVTDPAMAAEVTLQPVDRLGVDAAILFSDILVVPRAMGMELRVDEGIGPWFPNPLRSVTALESLRHPVPDLDLGFALEAIRLAKEAIGGRVPLIGFAGAPWTLAAYMIEGRGAEPWRQAKRFLVEEPAAAQRLLSRLAVTVGDYLQAQVRAGAQVIQVFESCGGALGPADFRVFALPHLAALVRRAREAGAPVIVFAPGAGWALEEIAGETGADVVGIDWRTEPSDARRRLAPQQVALQGNLDPAWLYAPPDLIRARTASMLAAFGGPGYIANLGHGVLPDTPVEHVQAFVDAVKESGADRHLAPGNWHPETPLPGP